MLKVTSTVLLSLDAFTLHVSETGKMHVPQEADD